MSECKHCVHNQSGHESYCGNCNINPVFSNNFRSHSKYYPLELRGNHVIQWLDSDRCITIAIFNYSKSEETWNLSFVGNRPVLNVVDWDDFKALIEIGFNLDKQE